MIFLQTGPNQPEFEQGEFSVNNTHSSNVVFISESPVMKMVHKRIKKLSQKNSPILILGEKGTGRTTVAWELFNNTTNPDPNHFIKLFLYGLNQDIIEQKLFTDADHLLSRGTDKTLFIKGIEHLNLELQHKLLSYLLDDENKAHLPRLICSSSEQISQKVKSFKFYPDLFSFLSKNILILPLLSERKEDIFPLISLFNQQNNFKGRISATALQALTSYAWPGNITELQNICSSISMFYPDKECITENELSIKHRDNKTLEKIIKYDPQIKLENIINQYIQMSLNHFQSKSRSAKALGISVKTIYNKIRTGHVILFD